MINLVGKVKLISLVFLSEVYYNGFRLFAASATMREILRMLLVLVMLFMAFSYSMVNLAILVIYGIKNAFYWIFWVFNTLTFMFGFCSIIILKAVSSMDWMTKELLINLTILFISLTNIFCFLLTFMNFVFNFWGGGIWDEENDAGKREVRTVFIMTFCTFVVNLAPYLTILYQTHKDHIGHKDTQQKNLYKP